MAYIIRIFIFSFEVTIKIISDFFIQKLLGLGQLIAFPILKFLDHRFDIISITTPVNISWYIKNMYILVSLVDSYLD